MQQKLQTSYGKPIGYYCSLKSDLPKLTYLAETYGDHFERLDRSERVKLMQAASLLFQIKTSRRQLSILPSGLPDELFEVLLFLSDDGLLAIVECVAGSLRSEES